MNWILIIAFSSLFSCGEPTAQMAADTQNVKSSVTPIDEKKEDTLLLEIIESEERSLQEEPAEVMEAPLKEVKTKTETSEERREEPPIIESTTQVQPNTEHPLASDTSARTKEVETPAEMPLEEYNIERDVDHALFNTLLSKYVNNTGKVNYNGLKNEVGALNNYLSLLEKGPDSGASRNEQLAFWINAYNAFTIKLILNNYPVKSITDISGGKPWDKKWIRIGDKTLSLNNIENDIIRPTFNEPRIHFAVNCAAKSCPPLHNRAFTSDNLNAKLEKLTRSFINNAVYNKVTVESLEISEIFNWYAEDFGDVKEYIDKYSAVDVSSSASLSFMSYNWALNN